MTSVSPDTRDADLLAQSAAFDQLEAEITEYELADGDDAICSTGRAPLHERQDECEQLLVTLCLHCARTHAGLAARVRTLLRIAPSSFELPSLKAAATTRR